MPDTFHSWYLVPRHAVPKNLAIVTLSFRSGENRKHTEALTGKILAAGFHFYTLLLMRTGLVSAGCHPSVFKMAGGYKRQSSAVAQTPPDGITVLAVVGRFNGHKAAEADTSYIRFFRHVSFNSLSFPGFCYASLINSQCSLYVAQYLCPTISVRKILFDEPHAIASRFSPNPSAQNADSPFTSRYGHSQNG